jgi:iron(III) transport system substrate-binding protein
VGATAALATVLAACAPGSSGGSTDTGSSSSQQPDSSQSSEPFSLDKLVAAAKKEGPITVYADSGKMVDIAKAFTKKYGIKATGVKSKTAATVEKITKLVKANNVTVDVALIDDAPIVTTQLQPQGITENYVPPDLESSIKPEFTDPLDTWLSPDYFIYDSKNYPSGCPIKNVWDLTTPKWHGKLAMEDVSSKSDFINFFTQLSLYGTDQLTQAYKDKFGKAPKVTEKNIAWKWVKEVLKNDPILVKSEDNAADAVGAPGQKHAPVGLMSPSKLKNNASKGYHLAVCDGMKPWVGFEHLVVGQIVKGTKNPNAAKLFIHYLMAGGTAPVLAGGKISPNTKVKSPQPQLVDPSKYQDDLFVLKADKKSLKQTAALRQKMQDFLEKNKS